MELAKASASQEEPKKNKRIDGWLDGRKDAWLDGHTDG